MEKIDVFIPTIKKDFNILPYTVFSLKKINHNIDQIYIVSPEDNEIIDFCKTNKIQFISETDMIPLRKEDITYSPKNINRAGWLYQQLLKLSADTVCNSEYILILDSDTVFLRKQRFIFKNRIRINYSKNERHKPYLDFINRIFPNFIFFPHSFVTHHFFLEKKILIELKENISTETKLNWYSAILSNLDNNEISSFSEYELLGNYYYNKYRNNVFFSDFKNVGVSEDCFFNKKAKIKIFSLYYNSCSIHHYNS
ncbi:DUF6492 family protein [Treponema sp. J25]|uniref:DUF6492 family protein n=1 Tax=Treponema sp. J25 TaxID=2094121 RepID=UPI00104F8D69|nr:DUF6492 family protein [Treponema sp. J25]TCW60532.1 hypothetical protein C5O22_11140 [Treponema sp. J25]